MRDTSHAKAKIQLLKLPPMKTTQTIGTLCLIMSYKMLFSFNVLIPYTFYMTQGKALQSESLCRLHIAAKTRQKVLQNCCTDPIINNEVLTVAIKKV
uniref:Uncharacterized protein n=1 Tax=Hyaloperonospora arabidopsidis (strain Emoy2) TaxID=559515 RepID=M4BWS0_HYAAE